MSTPVDDRSASAKAMSLVSEIIASCLLMVVPALIGYWIDGYLITGLLFTILGLIFGMTGAVLQLKRLVAVTGKTFGTNPSKNDDPPSAKSE